MEWNDRDRAALATRGISLDEAERQLELLRSQSKRIQLIRPATVGDGIRAVDESDQNRWQSAADEVADGGRILKFVPASGAATRMFRDLAPALDPDQPISESVDRFCDELERFPFFDELQKVADQNGVRLDNATTEETKRRVIRLLLTEDGLGYGDLAKGLILFHRYEQEARTAFEEQLREGARFAGDDRVARYHFTVPESDLHLFSVRSAEHSERIRKEMNVEVDATFSIQHPSTDTIATTPEGEPFRDSEGHLLFRPGGHGALLRNLDEIGGDFILIKNIDNIRPEPAQKDVAEWYRILIGCLASLEHRVMEALRSLGDHAPDAIDQAAAIAAELSRPWTGGPEDLDGKERHAVEALSRPLRACAVVKNEGEPGGAPFWVRMNDGRESLQIVEASQVDASDGKQMEIFRSSTHFNPVAIACAVRGPDGQPYDLHEFVDQEAAFVTTKSFGGRELRALEHPGLWNGGMAEWNTVFVEMPAMTFAPVKTVFDLLREEHRTGQERR